MNDRQLYNAAQWEWVSQRRKEGYSINALADFLGVSRETVRRHLLQINNLPCKEDMVLLDKDEFNRLGEQP